MHNSIVWCSLTYFYGPLLIILILNWISFACTLYTIYIEQRDVEQTISRIGRVNCENIALDRFRYVNQRFLCCKVFLHCRLYYYRLLMFIKLFATMCGFWIMEFISWAVKDSNGLWHIFDILNCLRGLWLLILCVIFSNRLRSRILKINSDVSKKFKISFYKNTGVITSTPLQK